MCENDSILLCNRNVTRCKLNYIIHVYCIFGNQNLWEDLNADNLKAVNEIMYVHVGDQWKSYWNYIRLISLHKKKKILILYV